MELTPHRNMSCILEGLYLGGLDDVHNTDALHQHGITHILTLDCKPLPLENHSAFTYKYVHALDMDTTDLLSHFEECINFIGEGREKGAVIVHCFVGHSRSSTIVLAYLMHKLSMSLDDSLNIVMKIRPQIRPNCGFRKQLELYESMGNRVDKNNPHYKMFRLANLARRMQIDKFRQGLSEESLSADPCGQNVTSEAIYKCRKCRRALFKSTCVLPHVSGKGEAAFDWRGKLVDTSTVDKANLCNKSLFVEPVEWMSSCILQLEGKLACPKCSAKLGSFNWSGEPCQCGTWVTPAFHINMGKVDFTKPKLAASPSADLHNISPSSMTQQDMDTSSKDTAATVHDGDSDTNEYVCMDQYLPRKHNFPQVSSFAQEAAAADIKLTEGLPPLE